MSTIAKSAVEEKQKLAPQTVRNEALARWALYAIVFFSGAVLMGVEIAGAKILAPGFGTSTYVWGSIIGLFMGALALGYYLGGQMADKKPTFTFLAVIVNCAGLWIAVVITYFGRSICDWVACNLYHPVFGPLVAALIIFFLPSFFMGMVAPYAVKLSAGSLAELGGVAGRLYALSTFGSIVCTLFTTFVLISYVSLSRVMQSLGLFLMVVALFSLWLFYHAAGGLKRETRTGLAGLALIALVCLEAFFVCPVEPVAPESCRLLYYEDSPYHEVAVAEDVVQSRKPMEPDYVLTPVNLWAPDDKNKPHWLHDIGRWLKFNDNTESGIFPYRGEYTNAVGYTDLLHLPVLWVHNPLPRRILVVGGGGSIIPTQYYSTYGSEVDVAELDPTVERVAKKYFQVPEAGLQAGKIRYLIGDGRQTVRNLKDGSYDVIVLDAYSAGGQIPFHLLTWEFLNDVKKKLSPRGALAANINSSIRNPVQHPYIRPADLFLAEYKTLTASRAEACGGKAAGPEDRAPLFNQVYVFPKVYSWAPMIPNGYEAYRNVIVVATKEEKRTSQDELVQRAETLSAGEHPVLKIRDMVWHAEQLYQTQPEELEGVPALSDDFAPVDLMYRPVRFEETSGNLRWY